MDKLFDSWNKQKKILDTKSRKLLFKEGEIWWCSLGVNIGQESCGKGSLFRRPIIILKKLSQSTCIAIPTTTKNKKGSWYHEIHVNGFFRYAMMRQIRFLSSNRLSVRESSLSDEQFFVLKKSVALLLGFS